MTASRAASVFRPDRTHLSLSDSGAASAHEVTPDFYPRLAAGTIQAAGPWLVGAENRDADSDAWWQHPNGDCVIIVVSGALSVDIDEPGTTGPLRIEAGHACHIPAGLWHRTLVHQPGQRIFLTAGAGTRRRPLTPHEPAPSSPSADDRADSPPPPTGNPVPGCAAQRYVAAARARDVEAAAAELADDVIMLTPTTDTPVTGRAAVLAALRHVEAACDRFEHVDLLASVHDHSVYGLVFEATVGDKTLRGIDLVTLDERDRIARFEVAARPLDALSALGARMHRPG